MCFQFHLISITRYTIHQILVLCIFFGSTLFHKKYINGLIFYVTKFEGIETFQMPTNNKRHKQLITLNAL